MAFPSWRRCAATSMKGIGWVSTRACWFIFWLEEVSCKKSASDLARGTARHGGGPALQALDRDLQARDTLVAADDRLLVVADRLHESQKLGAQRLGVADRQMPHRIAAVGLEAEALGHLPRQKIADHVFVARRDVHGARLERRQPIGIDVGENAGSGAELQERDVLARGARLRQLRLHLDDF